MRGKSHHCLGAFLVQLHMSHVPKHCTQAFLIGCIQPDRNPATYLKGSIRCQWLRGHNYPNAHRFMCRLARRLEGKHRLNLLDYYSLGKLIHYTADAFTLAHNAFFPTELGYHREYEVQLQEYFLKFLCTDPKVYMIPAQSIMDAIGQYHREYTRQEPHIHTDASYILSACCCILSFLFTSTTESIYASNFDHLPGSCCRSTSPDSHISCAEPVPDS